MTVMFLMWVVCWLSWYCTGTVGLVKVESCFAVVQLLLVHTVVVAPHKQAVYTRSTRRAAAYVRVVPSEGVLVKWLHLACAFPCAAPPAHRTRWRFKIKSSWRVPRTCSAFSIGRRTNWVGASRVSNRFHFHLWRASMVLANAERTLLRILSWHSHVWHRTL